MRRLTMFLLSVVLLGASACGAPFPLFATRTPTLTPTITPTFTRTLPPTYTPTPTPPPLESLGLGYFPHSLLIRQGWQITWDAPNSRYIIRQAAWDETYQTFLNRPTHGIGWIDLDGNFHTRLTRFSASENPDGTWTDTSITEDIVIPLISQNASTPQPGTRNVATWNLIETKNPAFEKPASSPSPTLMKTASPKPSPSTATWKPPSPPPFPHSLKPTRPSRAPPPTSPGKPSTPTPLFMSNWLSSTALINLIPKNPKAL